MVSKFCCASQTYNACDFLLKRMGQLKFRDRSTILEDAPIGTSISRCIWPLLGRSLFLPWMQVDEALVCEGLLAGWHQWGWGKFVVNSLILKDPRYLWSVVVVMVPIHLLLKLLLMLIRDDLSSSITAHLLSMS